MKYVSEEDLRAHLITDNCEDGCGYLDERDMLSLPWIELDEDEKYKVGHWIRHDNGKYHWYLCSCCDAMAGSDEKMMAYKYCPNCGAKMIEPQESENKE